jgi:hypothetical protein
MNRKTVRQASMLPQSVIYDARYLDAEALAEDSAVELIIYWSLVNDLTNCLADHKKVHHTSHASEEDLRPIWT